MKPNREVEMTSEVDIGLLRVVYYVDADDSQ